MNRILTSFFVIFSITNSYGQSFKNKFFVNNGIIINNTINETLKYPDLTLNFDFGYFSNYYLGLGCTVHNLSLKREFYHNTGGVLSNIAPQNSIGPKFYSFYKLKSISFTGEFSLLYTFNDKIKSKKNSPNSYETRAYNYGFGVYYHVNKNVCLGGNINYLRTKFSSKVFDNGSNLLKESVSHETNLNVRLGCLFVFNRKKT